MAAAGVAERAELLAGVAAGERRALSRLLTALEGSAGAELAADLHGRAPVPYTVGITGAPGAGKSTLTDGLVWVVREREERCAVVAVDPSSPLTDGAILGDRVRLRNQLAADDGVFFRSFANRLRLGGLSRALPGTIAAFGLAGWSTVLVETVGVGQAEVDIAAWADTTVVVVTPGWGDEIQANKSGLLEVADILVVNKADRTGRDLVEADLARMLDLSAERPWRPPILATVATEGEGIEKVWSAVAAHRRHLEESEELAARRRDRIARGVREEVAEAIFAEVVRAERTADGRALMRDVMDGDLPPAAAAAALLELARREAG